MCVLSGSDIYRDDAFLFCLQPSAERLDIQTVGDNIRTGYPELNRFLDQNQIHNLELWIPFATDRDHSGDIYLNRVYRAYLSEKTASPVSELTKQLTGLSFIHSAEPEPIRRPLYTPNDPQYNQQWFLNQINANDAWDFWNPNGGDLPGNPNVLLASIDTGVDWYHEDLVDHIWQNLNEDADGDGHTIEYVGGSWVLDPGDLNGIDDDDWDYNPNTFVDDLIGWDHCGWDGEEDNNPIPRQDVSDYSTWAHGTHVAGLLSASTDNSIGIASAAFNCSIMSIKVSIENQTGIPNIQEGYSGILYGAQAGHHYADFAVLNNSWGGPGYNVYEQATIDVAHDEYGAVIIAAGGNGDYGEEYATHYPSSYENVISVAPLGSGDAWHHWATYHETIDISAPGENIRSCVMGDHYSSWDGSSMAAPVVASTVGLMRSMYPEWNNIQLETMLLATADPVLYSVNSEGYLQGKLGTGRVDALMALQYGLYPQIEFIGENITILDGADNVLNTGESIELVFVLMANPEWGSAWNIAGELTTDHPAVDIQSSVAFFWDMAPGDASLNELDPYLIEFEDGSAGTVDFTLTLTSNQTDWLEYRVDIPFTIEVAGSAMLPGDLNGDESLDVLDVVTLAGIIIGSTDPTPDQEITGDLNEDGILDVLDIILLVGIIIG